MRPLYFGLGWLFFALGIFGIFLPVVPTTPFMLLALWAFSKSSDKFHDWLYHHSLFGPPLQQWQAHRVIPPGAKFFAVGFMTLSLCYLVLYSAVDNWLKIAAAVFMTTVAIWILSKPSKSP